MGVLNLCRFMEIENGFGVLVWMILMVLSLSWISANTEGSFFFLTPYTLWVFLLFIEMLLKLMLSFETNNPLICCPIFA